MYNNEEYTKKFERLTVNKEKSTYNLRQIKNKK